MHTSFFCKPAFTGLLLLLFCLHVAAQPAGAAEEPTTTLEGLLSEPMPAVPTALGSYSFDISTDNDQARYFFKQGLQLEYAFGKYEAIRSFREAQKHDSDCAMCYWGEAWAWGSYLNQHMPEAEAPYALAAIEKALALKSNATEREQAFIDAMSARYVADYDYDTRKVQHAAYAEAMRQVHEAYPEDLDAATLYADALFLLEERRGYRNIALPGIQRIRDILQSVLDRNIRHPGACHLYIHLTESTEQPGLAEPCAEFIGSVIPGASHINHMPSHTWNEVGRWGDSVRANIQAVHSDQKAVVNEGVPIYPTHNLQMLLYSASFDGQSAIAIQAGKDWAKLTNNNMFHLLTLVRFGRFDEIPALTEQPDGDYPAGVWEFSQGYARLRHDDLDFARAHLARLQRLADSSEQMFRFDPVTRLLNVLAGILKGEIYLYEEDVDSAESEFELAVEHEDRLDYDEPEAIPFSARHWLGALLLETERFAEAEQVFRDELDDHPHNGWSLYGLDKALAGQDKVDPEVVQDLEQSWARADVWLNSTRY